MSLSRSYAIRSRLDHPVIDADGHTSEYLPAFGTYLRDVGITTDFNQLFHGVLGAAADWYEHTPAERRRKHLTKSPWWTRPMRDARDRADVGRNLPGRWPSGPGSGPGGPPT